MWQSHQHQRAGTPVQHQQPTTIHEYCQETLVDSDKERLMKKLRGDAIDKMEKVLEELFDERVHEFKKRRGVKVSWFDVTKNLHLTEIAILTQKLT